MKRKSTPPGLHALTAEGSCLLTIIQTTLFLQKLEQTMKNKVNTISKSFKKKRKSPEYDQTNEIIEYLTRKINDFSFKSKH